MKKAIALVFLVTCALPAMRNGHRCAPVGPHYTVTYTITYDFRLAGLNWQVIYPNLCPCQVEQ